MNYKQGIQCWASNWQGFVSQVRNEQNNTRHTEVLKSSLRCSKPNTALQSSLCQSSNHCKTPNHAVPAQGAAPRHTQSLDPNRRPYTTERHLFTQNNTAPQSFQLVFRGPVPRCATMRQLQFQSQNCDEVHKFQDAKCVAHQTDAHELLNNPTADVRNNVQTSRRLFPGQGVSFPHGNSAAVLNAHTLVSCGPMQVSSSPRTGFETSCCACRW